MFYLVSIKCLETCLVSPFKVLVSTLDLHSRVYIPGESTVVLSVLFVLCQSVRWSIINTRCLTTWMHSFVS